MSIAPTDNKYDLYVGMKGKLANSLHFNVRVSNKNQADRALFLVMVLMEQEQI